jgi:protein-disulfide isomerase
MNTSNKYFLPAAVVIAGLFIAGAVVWNGMHPAGPSGTGATAKVDIKDVKTDGRPYIGDENAPVTIAFWSDFQCPFCQQFELTTLPQIIQDYVNAGKVKVVFLEFPFLGQDSVTDAAYSLSVWKLYPEKYFEWRTAMYNAQDAEGDQGFGDAASVDKLNATISGIDAAKVAADVKTNLTNYEAQMNADKTQGQALGINATPSFIIGKQAIAGAYPYATFQATIDPLLK